MSLEIRQSQKEITLKFYSDVTKKLYDTEEALQKAEIAVDEKKNARETRAKEVEAAIKAAQDANKKAHDLLSQFCADYGSYHTSISNVSDSSLFDWLTDLFMF